MAYDKAVDSAQLESGLTSIADAIREKGGTAEPLEFPQGMADAVAAIPSGGSDEYEKMLNSVIDGTCKVFKSTVKTIAMEFYSTVWDGIDSFNFPEATKAYGKNMKFNSLKKASHFYFPKLETPSINFFNRCAQIKFLDFPKLKEIPRYFVWHSDALETLILRSPALVPMADVNAFEYTKIAGGTGYVYVPKALVEQYKSATNWVTYATQIRAIEDYPDITGGAV